jgi:hypothetical protein
MQTAHITNGRLKRVLADCCPLYSGYHLYYPSRRQPSAALTLLVEALRHRGEAQQCRNLAFGVTKLLRGTLSGPPLHISRLNLMSAFGVLQRSLEHFGSETALVARKRDRCAWAVATLVCKQARVLLAQFAFEQFAARVPRQRVSEHDVLRHLE